MGRVAGRSRLDVLAVFLDVGFLLENTAVFQSQVGDQLEALSRLGYTTGILAVVHDPEKFEKAIGARLRDANVEIFPVADGGFFACLIRFVAALRALAKTRAIGRGYVRGIWGAIVIALAGGRTRVPYVYDVRGALLDEMAALGASRVKRYFYGAVERWCVRGAVRVSAVSRALSEVVSSEHRVARPLVIPCCVDSRRMCASDEQARMRRAALRFVANECVLVYSGGLSHYQQVPAMLAIWRRLLPDPELRFLLLTNEDPHRSPMLVGDLGDFGDRLIHLSLLRDEVPATLAAADIGFMLRDGRELNRVASPVKFPEYLCAGLAVVASPGTGDTSESVVSNDVGILIDPTDLDRGVGGVRHLISRWRSNRDGFKSRSRLLARSQFDWRAHANTFADLYGSVSASAETIPVEER